MTSAFVHSVNVVRFARERLGFEPDEKAGHDPESGNLPRHFELQPAVGKVKVSLMLVDEAAEVADSAYLSVRPMLAMGGQHGGKLWLMSTPEGRRGFFYRAWMDPDGGWFKLSVPATENPRISQQFLERERRDMGERWFRQEYLCEFVNVLDGYFEEEVVRGCVRPEVPALW